MKHLVFDTIGKKWFGKPGAEPLEFPTAEHAQACAEYLTKKYGRAFLARSITTEGETA